MATDGQGCQASKETNLALGSLPASDKPSPGSEPRPVPKRLRGGDSWSRCWLWRALLTQTTCYLCPAAQGSWLRLAKLHSSPTSPGSWIHGQGSNHVIKSS